MINIKNIVKLQNAGLVPSIQENIKKKFIRSLDDFDPYWQVRMSKKLANNFTFNNTSEEQNDSKPVENTFEKEQIPVQINTTSVNVPMHELKAREMAKANTINKYESELEAYRKYPMVKVPEWFSLLQQTAPDNRYANILLNKTYTDYGKKLYNEKYNEYLVQHPTKSGTGIGYDAYYGIQQNPLIKRQQAAHDYAVKESGYVGDNSTAPYKDVDDVMTSVGIMGTSLIPLIGASVGTFGNAIKTAADIKFGYDGAKGLVSPNGVPKTINFVKQGRYGRALRSGTWDLFDLALAKQGIKGLNSFGKYAKDVADVAKFNMWNKANKFRMEYPWQRKEVLPNILQKTSKPQFNVPLWTTDNLLKGTTYPMLRSVYKDGGSLKFQMGGLVYKPFIPEKEKIIREATPAVFDEEETYSYIPEENDSFDLEVEPVLVYKSIIKKEPAVQPEQVEETPIQIDKTTVETPIQIDKTTVETQGKVEFSKSNLDVGNMQELIDLMVEEGMRFRITSGNRPGATTKSGKVSHHSSGNALDITPASGQSWEDLIDQMKNSERFITYMHEHNLGILDERSKEIQAKTGATGAHFHIGPDKTAVTNFKSLIG